MVKQDNPESADAILILMGSISDRVLQADDLYQKGLATKIIMVDTSQPDIKTELKERGATIMSNTIQAYNALVSIGIPSDSIIILSGGARSTIMEAIISRDYIMSEPSIERLILVSSSDHTRRAKMIFQSAFIHISPPIEIYCSPSIYTGFDADTWWRNKKDIQAVLSEYAKILYFLFIERRILRPKFPLVIP